ncbi:MAG: hypothetical protein ABIQ07_10640, partial [Ginsengibacter sp.]
TILPPNFFSRLPHRVGMSANWQAQIHSNAGYYSEYIYSIFWIPEGSNDILEYDPIISIKPDGSYFKILILKIVTVVLGLLGISLFLRKKKKSK